jgi:hypothetical protein
VVWEGAGAQSPASDPIVWESRVSPDPLSQSWLFRVGDSWHSPLRGTKRKQRCRCAQPAHSRSGRSPDVPAWLESPGGIAVDAQDSPVFTGEFVGIVQFGPFTLRARYNPLFLGDFFVAKASPQGQIQWAMAGGGGTDKFRIKIWDKATSVVVYDNVPGASDDIDLANPKPMGGGSIVIQKAK